MTIVPYLHVLNDRSAGQGAGGKWPGDAFSFEGSEEALDDGLVEAVAYPTHTQLDPWLRSGRCGKQRWCTGRPGQSGAAARPVGGAPAEPCAR